MQGNTIIRTTQRTIATNTPAAAIANNANHNKFIRITPINHPDQIIFINTDQIESIESVPNK